MTPLAKEVTHLSGPLKHPSNKILYGSYHFPKFYLPNAQRNTLRRFEQFCVYDVTGKTVLDVGANMGSMAFEAVRRGAAKAVCLEFNADRCNAGNKLAKHLNVPVEFRCLDVDESFPLSERYDVAFCCALDQHVKDPQLLYTNLSKTAQTLYFESNHVYSVDELQSIFSHLGYRAMYLGRNDDDKYCNTRKLFFATKESRISSKNCHLPGALSAWNSVSFKEGDRYVKIYGSVENWANEKACYEELSAEGMKHYLCPTDFTKERVCMREWIGIPLAKVTEPHPETRKSFIKAIKVLAATGHWAHRDLHTENVLVMPDYSIRIIDWETAIRIGPLPSPVHHYDVAGTGAPHSPIFPSGRDIFTPGPICLAKKLRLSRKDFL